MIYQSIYQYILYSTFLHFFFYFFCCFLLFLHCNISLCRSSRAENELYPMSTATRNWKLKAWMLKKKCFKHFGQLEIDLEIENGKLLNWHMQFLLFWEDISSDGSIKNSLYHIESVLFLMQCLIKLLLTS